MSASIQNSQSWAESNFGTCDLGDKRRTQRAVQVASRMADHPSGSSPRQMIEWAELKGCYRLFNSESVTFDSLARPHWEQTCASARGRVLIINDTTEISYGKVRKISGLGPVGIGSTSGFYLHNALMVDAQTDAVLGLARQELFHRIPAPEKENRRQRARRPRETEVWGRVIDAIGAPAAGVEHVHVCDRGADNLEVFCHLQQQHSEWVIRCSHLNRDVQPVLGGELGRLVSIEKLLKKVPVLGTFSLSLRGRDGQKKREVNLEIRVIEVSIPQPRRRTPYLRKLNFRGLRQTIVEVREVAPRRGTTPLRWVLWTSLPVQSFDDAKEVAEIYEKRWLVEELHKAIKTGCQLETRQYETSQALEALAGMTSILAVRLLMMKQIARAAPETPAIQVIPKEWIRILELLRKRTLPTVRDFIRNLAALGGFLMRKGDGEPGWITIWRGLDILIIALKTADAIKQRCG